MPNPGTGYLPDVEIYSGHPVFEPGLTPFGFYDNDSLFAGDAPRVARFIASRLGYPVMDIELQDQQMFAAFEEAVTTYGNSIYAWKVRENYLSLEGGSKDIKANDMVLEPSLQRIVEIAKNYGTEAEVGGNITLNHGLLEVKAGVQDYDLDEWAREQGIEGGIEIRRIFYEAPPAILRYFDPYAGTGTGIQSLMDAFDFGSYSPGVNFLLMPVSADILKIQAIEFNDQVRRSAYSFRIVNNKLTLFPIPSQDGVLRIEYYKLSDKKKLNPRISKYRVPSAVKLEFEASAGETVELDFGALGVQLDPDVSSFHFYQNIGQGRVESMIPEDIVINGGKVQVTFRESFAGIALINYMSIQSGQGTIEQKYKYSKNISVGANIPVILEHNLGSENVIVQVYSNQSLKELVIPAEITVLNRDKVRVSFSDDITGKVVVTAIPELNQGQKDLYSFRTKFKVVVPEDSSSTTYRFRHNLNTVDISVQVYEEIGGEPRMMIPASVKIINSQEVVIEFLKDTEGYVVFNAVAEVVDEGSDVITNVSEVPYENPTYSKINSIGKQWIFRYALAIAREMLAYVRGKYSTVPVPDSEVTLNHGDLLTDARSEKEALLKELNDMLDSTSRQAQLQRKAEETEYMQKTLVGVPMPIFIG